jgi:hypothetical protein
MLLDLWKKEPVHLQRNLKERVMAKNRVQAIARTSFDAATLNASYQGINASGLDEACFLIRILNNSTATIDVSYDGTTDHDRILASGLLEIPSQTNGSPQNWAALFAKGMIVYVKGTAGVGTIYLMGYYTDPS